jgi:hypothetical protein
VAVPAELPAGGDAAQEEGAQTRMNTGCRYNIQPLPVNDELALVGRECFFPLPGSSSSGRFLQDFQLVTELKAKHKSRSIKLRPVACNRQNG